MSTPKANRRAAAANLRAEAYERLAQAERLEAAELLELEPDAAPVPRQKQKHRTKPLVGPLQPVTDDLAVARASRMRRSWCPQ